MNSRRLSLVHPTGNPNSRNAALAFGEIGILHEIITTIAYDPEHTQFAMMKVLPTKLRHQLTKELSRRTWVAPRGSHLRTHPERELMRLFFCRLGLTELFSIAPQQLVDWVYTFLDGHVAIHHLQGLHAVYAYEDGAATTFQMAKQEGIRCFYDLPAMFYQKVRRIHEEESELFPALASAMTGAQEPKWKLERKEQEVLWADHIFVASTGTHSSLLEAGIEATKISIIPYGAPTEYFQPQAKRDSLFRAIFIGLISPRKGIHYLLQAWRELGLSNAELLFVGANQFPSHWLAQYADCFQHIPSVPHHDLNPYYSDGSIFVFPSLVEGFGMVLLEAMACGLPVITTPNTAGPDILTDDVEGFIVPIRDVEALKAKLIWCYEHPQELAEMGRAARRRAEALTWERYRWQLASRVQELLG